jgi:high-affinity iron transporter
MLGALIIVFREVIEAGLIVGIVMAATRGVNGRGRWVGFGISAGVLGAAVVAIFAGAISQAFEGAGQELFSASVLGIAVVMLMWHNAWMARHGREIAEEMQSIGMAVSEGAKPLTALAVVVGLAVLREGSEVVLFLYGIFASGTSGAALMVGGLLGIAAGAAFTGLTYVGLLAIPTRHIFSVTSWLIALLAAGMAAQSVQFLNNAGVVVAFDRTVWDTSWLLSEGSLFGKLLHTLIGYTERPTEMQLMTYIATLFLMFLLMRLARRFHAKSRVSAAFRLMPRRPRRAPCRSA